MKVFSAKKYKKEWLNFQYGLTDEQILSLEVFADFYDGMTKNEMLYFTGVKDEWFEEIEDDEE